MNHCGDVHDLLFDVRLWGNVALVVLILWTRKPRKYCAWWPNPPFEFCICLAVIAVCVVTRKEVQSCEWMLNPIRFACRFMGCPATADPDEKRRCYKKVVDGMRMWTPFFTGYFAAAMLLWKALLVRWERASSGAPWRAAHGTSEPSPRPDPQPARRHLTNPLYSDSQIPSSAGMGRGMGMGMGLGPTYNACTHSRFNYSVYANGSAQRSPEDARMTNDDVAALAAAENEAWASSRG